MIFSFCYKAFFMETDKEKLERLIKDEFDSIEKLKAKKRDIDKYVDMHIEYIDKYRERLNALQQAAI